MDPGSSLDPYCEFRRHLPRRNEPEHDHQVPALFDENIKMWSKTAGHRLCMRQKLTVTENMDAGFSLHPNIEVRGHLQQQHPFCSQQLIQGDGCRLEPASIQRSSWTSPSTKWSSINWQRSLCWIARLTHSGRAANAHPGNSHAYIYVHTLVLHVCRYGCRLLASTYSSELVIWVHKLAF